MKCKCKKNL